MKPDLRKMVPADLDAVVEVLARAFDDDPWVTWLVRADARRAQAVRRFFRLTVEDMAMRHDEIYTTAEVAGAAVWVPPGKWKLSLWRELPSLPAMISIVTARRLLGVWKKSKGISDLHPHEPHWYLMHLGVDPDQQGRGLGAALLAPVLERCDREGTPAYLETAKERNLGFYRRSGFEVKGEFAIADGPTVWTMWRAPQPVGSADPAAIAAK